MVIDYVDGFEYHDGAFASYMHPQGRVAPGENGVNCEYFIKDHLGSVRVIYADVDRDEVIDFDTVECELLEEHHYYPFGLEMEGMWTDFRTGQYVNRYTYNGKQAQTEMGWEWLNFGKRFYDPLVARFTGVDPIADQYAHITTYNYAENQPVSNIDLWGLQAVLAVDARLVGYKVQHGQGPTQIAKDLNTNYSDKLASPISWTNIVFANPTKFQNVFDGDGKSFDKNNPDFKSGNIKPGDFLIINNGFDAKSNNQDDRSKIEAFIDSLEKEQESDRNSIMLIRDNLNSDPVDPAGGLGLAKGILLHNLVKDTQSRQDLIDKSKGKRDSFITKRNDKD